MEFPVRTENLWKRFGTFDAVRGLNLGVPPQSVYGFLGPNGAGKFTTIRMILGLQHPTQGRISLFGRPLERERVPLLRRIGSLVESASLYLHLTGRENLEVHRRLLGISRSFIDEALATVGLTSVAGRLVRNYSSGMKQRPIPRWTLYVTKLIVAAALITASTLFLLCGILLSGAILPHIQPLLTFQTGVPWAMLLRNCFYIVVLEFLALTIQHWVSLRWRSFSNAIATGMIGLVLGFMAATAGRQAGWPEYFPWALPMLVLAQKPHDLPLAAMIALPLGVAVVAAGCLEFSRRDAN